MDSLPDTAVGDADGELANGLEQILTAQLLVDSVPYPHASIQKRKDRLVAAFSVIRTNLLCSGHLQTTTARKQGEKSAASRRYARQTCTNYWTRYRSGIGECIDVAKSVQAINRESCISGKRKYVETLI